MVRESINGTGDHRQAVGDLGSAGLLNLSLTLGAPVLRVSGRGNDVQLGVSIAGPVLNQEPSQWTREIEFSEP